MAVFARSSVNVVNGTTTGPEIRTGNRRRYGSRQILKRIFFISFSPPGVSPVQQLMALSLRVRARGLHKRYCTDK